LRFWSTLLCRLLALLAGAWGEVDAARCEPYNPYEFSAGCVGPLWLEVAGEEVGLEVGVGGALTGVGGGESLVTAMRGGGLDPTIPPTPILSLSPPGGLSGPLGMLLLALDAAASRPFIKLPAALKSGHLPSW
jgi:hypothetical protein